MASYVLSLIMLDDDGRCTTEAVGGKLDITPQIDTATDKVNHFLMALDDHFAEARRVANTEYSENDD